MNIQLAHFELLEEIGHGGLGLVFKAYDPSLNRNVAIKLLKDEYAQDPKFVENFLRESRNAAAISHPHIAQVHFVGEYEGNYYLVLELIHGRSLDQIVRTDGPLPEAKALRIAIEIAEALKAGYANQMIHGDIKPQNIMVADEGGAKLLDFGLAQLANVEADSSEGVWGSPYYISPERVGRKAEDFRSDVYSLGATLFEALVGHPPFEAADPTELALKRLNEKPPLLRTLNPAISKRTEQIVDKMLHKNLLMRFLDYDSLLKELRKAEAAALGNGQMSETGEMRRATGYMTGQIPIPQQRSPLPLIIAASAVSALVILVLLYFLVLKKTPTQGTDTVVTASPTAGPTPMSMKNGSKKVQFHYRDAKAQQVMLSGNLNMWQPEAMRKQAGTQDMWVLDKEIPLGVAIEYQFVVDGINTSDPERPGSKFPDGKGSFKTVWDPSSSPLMPAATPPAVATPKPSVPVQAVVTNNASAPSPSSQVSDYQAGIKQSEQLLREFMPIESDKLARSLKPSGPREGDIGTRNVRLVGALTNFTNQLRVNILKAKYPNSIVKSDGTKLEGGINRLTDDGVIVSTPAGDVSVPFKDISLASLLAMHDYYITPASHPSIIQQGKWNTGCVAIIFGAYAEGRMRLEEALKMEPNRQRDYDLILQYTPDSSGTPISNTTPGATTAQSKTASSPASTAAANTAPAKGARRLVYTGFDYPITNNLGTTFIAASDTGLVSGTWNAGNKIISPGLDYPGLKCIGNALQFSNNVNAMHGIDMNAIPDAYKQIDRDLVTRIGVAGTEIWVRLLLRVDDDPKRILNNSAGLDMMGASAGGGVKVNIGISDGKWSIGKFAFYNPSNTPAVSGQTVLLVAKLKWGIGKLADEAQLFVNPPLGSRSPVTPDAVMRNMEIGTIDRISFKSPIPMTADEFVLAADWNSLW